MDDRTALLRAAVRYCISASQDVRDRTYSGRMFTAVYARDPQSDPGWRELGARQAILFAIQTAVESLPDEASPTPDNLHARLLELGCTTPPAWGEREPIEQEERAIAEERERFCTYVQRLTALHACANSPRFLGVASKHCRTICASCGGKYGLGKNAVSPSVNSRPSDSALYPLLKITFNSGRLFFN